MRMTAFPLQCEKSSSKYVQLAQLPQNIGKRIWAVPVRLFPFNFLLPETTSTSWNHTNRDINMPADVPYSRTKGLINKYFTENKNNNCITPALFDMYSQSVSDVYWRHGRDNLFHCKYYFQSIRLILYDRVGWAKHGKHKYTEKKTCLVIP